MSARAAAGARTSSASAAARAFMTADGSARADLARLSTRRARSRDSPGRRLPRRVEPRLEERVQVLAGDLLGQGYELRRVRVPVAVLGGPRLQDLEERVVADLLAQRLQRHAAAAVD